MTLAEYREKHIEQLSATADFDARVGLGRSLGSLESLNTFADLRGATTALATIDDHEVTNDFAGGAAIASDDRFSGDPSALINDSALFEAGLQAFEEFMPIESRRFGDTGDARTAGEIDLFRVNTYGSDAAVFVLDTRSFRDAPLVNPDLALAATDPVAYAADAARFQIESFDPNRTLLGAAQLNALLDSLRTAEANGVTWKFVMVPEPIQLLGPGLEPADKFEGYVAERTQVLRFIDDNNISNVVFVTADIHGTLTNNLTYQTRPGGQQIALPSFEVSTGSVAYDAPLGQTVVPLAAAAGLLSAEEVAVYNMLPSFNPQLDPLGEINDRNDFFEALSNGFNTPFGLDPLGLDQTLPQAAGLIDATLAVGDYTAAHTYGWTQFDIDQDTQVLTVTTYGIDPYTETDLAADPEAIATRAPTVVSQFTVAPQAVAATADFSQELGPVSADLTTGTATIAATATPSMMVPIGDTAVAPLLTVGETLPSTGLFNALNNPSTGYTPPGVLDGLGVLDLGGAVRVFANHELLNNAGYEYQVADGLGGSFTMAGARVSYFDIDKTTLQIVDAGLAYDTIYDANGMVASDRSFLGTPFAPFFGGPESAATPAGFSRLCSSVLITAEEFGNGRGLASDIYFTGEEDGSGFNSVGGAEWALDVADGELWQVPDLARGSWENVTELDTGSPDHVALILADDTAPFDADGDGADEAAPLYLYVGEKDASGDFLAQNGLRGGSLYVWVADNAEVNSPAEFNGFGTEAGRFIEIDNAPQLAQASTDGTTGFDLNGYPTQSTLWSRAEALGAFGFSRPEDVATDPTEGNTFVLASTGVDTFDIDPTTGNGADTFGTVYAMQVDFTDLANPSGSLLIFYDGDSDPARRLRSPDNLDWADDGAIYIQEDKAEDDTASGDEVLFGDGAANPNEAGIVRYMPETGDVTRVANIDRGVVLDASLADPTLAVDGDAGAAGEWESSGILDVSAAFGQPGGSLFLFDVQAHGIADQEEVNPASRITDADLVEGGQLSVLATEATLLPTPQPTTLVLNADVQNLVGSAGDDTLVGNAANNRLVGGPGSDELIGAAGDDLLDARGGGADALDGGAGADAALLADALDTVTVSGDRAAATASGSAGTVSLDDVEILTDGTQVTLVPAADPNNAGYGPVDAAFYLAANPDVAAAVAAGDLASASLHFDMFGRAESRAPNPLFSPAYYLAQNPDVAAAVAADAFDSAFEHYASFGGAEGRATSVYFDTLDYLDANTDVALSGLNPLSHFLTFGVDEGRFGFTADGFVA